MIWFTSDIYLYPSSSDSNDHYNDYIINKWNTDIAALDDVYVLGGLFRTYREIEPFNKNYVEKIIDRLNGRIHLVPNEDVDDFLLYSYLDSIGKIEWQFQYDFKHYNYLMIATCNPIDVTTYSESYDEGFEEYINIIGNGLARMEDLTDGCTYAPASYTAKRGFVSIDDVWEDANQSAYVDALIEVLNAVEEEDDDWNDWD
jgi:hypothetical protein